MSDEKNNDSSFHFPESDEKQFLEKMERLEGKLDDLEQQVLQALSEVEIPNTWLEEWEKFTNSAPESGERELGKLKGFEALDQLEQNQIASLYQDALLFSREILSRKEQLGGTLTDEERDVLNYIQNSIR